MRCPTCGIDKDTIELTARVLAEVLGGFYEKPDTRCIICGNSLDECICGVTTIRPTSRDN